MDPDETLRLMRVWVQAYRDNDGDAETCAEQMAEHFEALDEWLTKKGLFPKDWS